LKSEDATSADVRAFAGAIEHLTLSKARFFHAQRKLKPFNAAAGQTRSWNHCINNWRAAQGSSRCAASYL
jgi:hypothetical protein